LIEFKFSYHLYNIFIHIFLGDYSLTFKTKGKILHSRVPPMAKYNLHQYVSLLKLKKKFGESPPSPFSYLFEGNKYLSCHSYKFIR
jgi:hypothetical protein